MQTPRRPERSFDTADLQGVDRGGAQIRSSIDRHGVDEATVVEMLSSDLNRWQQNRKRRAGQQCRDEGSVDEPVLCRPFDRRGDTLETAPPALR